MIRLAQRGAEHCFSAEQVVELQPVLARITRDAATLVVALVARYGPVSDDDPERVFLLGRVSVVFEAWCAKVRKLGARPLPMWRVAFRRADGGVHYWQYDRDWARTPAASRAAEQ